MIYAPLAINWALTGNNPTISIENKTIFKDFRTGYSLCEHSHWCFAPSAKHESRCRIWLWLGGIYYRSKSIQVAFLRIWLQVCSSHRTVTNRWLPKNQPLVFPSVFGDKPRLHVFCKCSCEFSSSRFFTKLIQY